MAEPVEPGRDKSQKQAEGSSKEAQGGAVLPSHSARTRTTVSISCILYLEWFISVRVDTFFQLRTNKIYNLLFVFLLA